MALSQAQKKFITLLAQDPENAFKKIKEKEIDLNSYKNCFYKDGTSLLHTLINGVIVTPSIHLPIITYVLENSSLSLEDKATGKNSAIEFYQDYYKDYFYSDYIPQGLNVVQNYYRLIEANKDKNSTGSIYLCVCNLKKYGFNIEYENLVPYLKNKYSNSTALLREIIIQDDLNALNNWFVLNPASKEFFLQQNFFLSEGKINHNNQIISGLRNKDEKSNALIFTIYKNAHKISNYLVDNEMLPLDGSIDKHQYYGNYKSNTIPVSALSQCLHNNYEMFEKVFYKLNKEQLSTSFTMKERVLNKYSHTDVLDSVLNHHNFKFRNLLMNNAADIMYYSEKPIEILHSIISTSASIEVISNTLNHFIQYWNINNKVEYPYTSFANRFFSNITTREIINDLDHTLITECIKNLKEKRLLLYDTHMVFTTRFFENEEIFNSLVRGGLDLKNTSISLDNEGETQKSINLLEMAISMRAGKGSYNSTKITNYNPKILKEIKNLIGENAVIINNTIKESIIASSINANQYDILDLYTNSEIKTLTQIEKQFINPWFNLTQREKFENFINRCIDSDIIFCDNVMLETQQGILKYEPLFYSLLAHDVNINILNKILDKENKTIYNLSKDPNFWQHITSEEISKYVKSSNADYNQPEILLSLCKSQNLNTIKLYLEYGGNITYKDNDQDTLLHILVKNGYYKPANLLIEYYPDLNSVVNRQNKFAASYLLEDLNKKCKDPSKMVSNSSKDEFSSMVDLACNMFSTGFQQSNKKPVEFLNTQLEKYDAIFKYKPELKNMMQYGVLQNKIITKEDSNIKKKKI